MKLHWYGHACFLLESEDGRLVLDPYAPAYVPGLRLPALQAELCLCSHDHSDHNHSQSVRLTGQPCTMNITRIPCFHDEKGGSLRGQNFLTVVETEGLRIAHAGDLGKKLEAIQNVEYRVVGPILSEMHKRGEDFRLLLLPDHPTLLTTRTHDGSPVPYAIYDSRTVKAALEKDGKIPLRKFCEKEMLSEPVLMDGTDLMRVLFEQI